MRAFRAILLLALGAFVLGFWIARAWYGRWIADDFCFAVSSVRDGFWRSQALVYERAAGRFTVAFLYAALTRLGSWTARWLSLSAMAVWLAAAWKWSGTLQRDGIERVAIAIGFVAAIVNAAPDAYQPLVWTGGLFTYGLPVIGATAMAALIEAPVAILFVLAFICGGCSEVAAVAQLVFACALAIVMPRHRKAFVAIAVGSAIAFTIVAAAPGNYQRRTLFHPLPVPEALGAAIATTAPTYAEIVVEGCTLFVPLIVVLALGQVRMSWRVAAAALAASVMTVTATLFGGLVGTGRLPWGRVQFVPIAGVAIAFAFVGFALRIERYAAIATVALIAFGAIGVATTFETRVGEVQASRQFAAAADRVARAPRGANVVLAAPHEFDYLEFVTRDPAHWTNRCIADYYGLLSIRSSR